ncbi:MAG: hypothetical protein H6627_07650 [Calditrichae bacterium]|nr:hypothetical protein [Calditrichota bacterium]MCB9058425.1 hypothetical protein [Calditrichia bacterium]
MKLTTKIGFLILIITTGCDIQINKNININDNSSINSDLIAVNGDIHIGNDCEIQGDINTVNGNIYIDKNCNVKGNVLSLTGLIIINDSTEISGNVSGLSGQIKTRGVKITGDVVKNYGNISAFNTRVEGSIVIEENADIPEKLRKVKVSLGKNSIISGNLQNNNRQVLALVYIEPGSVVNGEMIDFDISESLEDFQNE